MFLLEILLMFGNYVLKPIAVLTLCTLFTSAVNAESWNCRNEELEINCFEGKCEISEAFTPMSVDFGDSGEMQVCAYSGCWVGTGTVVRNGNFLIVSGNQLQWIHSDDNDGEATIALDTSDNVAVLKSQTYAHPLTCQLSE